MLDIADEVVRAQAQEISGGREQRNPDGANYKIRRGELQKVHLFDSAIQQRHIARAVNQPRNGELPPSRVFADKPFGFRHRLLIKPAFLDAAAEFSSSPIPQTIA